MLASDRLRSLGADVLAGLTVACVALPLNLALAIASGVPASMGLVSGIVAGVVAALFGGARLQITGPEAALVGAVLVIAQRHGAAGVALAAMGAGVIQMGLGLARAGRLVRLMPPAVVRGFMAGIGVLLLISQLPVLFGGSEPNQKLAVIADPQREHIYGAIVGFIAIGLMVFAGRVGALLALTVSTTVVLTVAANIGIPEVGALPTTLFTWQRPALDSVEWGTLLPLTLSLGLVASLGSLLSAASLDEMLRDRGDKTNFDRELIAQGLANLACGAVGGMPVMGAVVRSMTSVQAGAKTRVASIAMALVLLVAVTLGGELVARVPIPALAGILVVVGVRLLGWPATKALWQTDRASVLVVVVTAALIATTSVYLGIGGGLVLSLVIYLRRLGALDVRVRTASRSDCSPAVQRLLLASGGAEIVTVRGAVIFSGAARLDALTPSRPPWPRLVVVDLRGVPHVDGAGLAALRRAIDTLAVRGGRIALVGKPRTLVDAALTRAAVLQGAVGERLFGSVSEALAFVVGRASREDAPPVPVQRVAAARG